jgi:hypothetical protein
LLLLSYSTAELSGSFVSQLRAKKVLLTARFGICCWNSNDDDDDDGRPGSSSSAANNPTKKLFRTLPYILG